MNRSYRPSNGTEGACFMDQFCDRCWFDRNEDCEVLAAAFAHEVGDPLYPSQWIVDNDGFAQCTQYRATETKLLPADESKQMSLSFGGKA